MGTKCRGSPLGKGGIMLDEERSIHFNKLLKNIHEHISLADLDDENLYEEISRLVKKEAKNESWNFKERFDLAESIFSEIRGFGILDKLISDENVTEIMVNGFNSIFFEKNGILNKSKLKFSSKEKYEDMVQRIVGKSGKEVNQRTPIVDCRMKDGSRVNVVLSPISERGTALTIRKFQKKKRDLADLVRNGTLTPEASRFLKSAIKAKLNIFISGGTGSGKTTLLNALSMEIGGDERIITIEDARELNFINKDNWVALEARRESASGNNRISIRDLIRASLRMRPDRIIVGEVRGEEAVDMLQAMNTGHDGSISTGHANSVEDMQSRLETMILSGSVALPLQAIREQIGSALDLCIHVSRRYDYSRKIVSIAEVVWDGQKITYNKLFEIKKIKTDDGNNKEILEFTGNQLKNDSKFLREGVDNTLCQNLQKLS